LLLSYTRLLDFTSTLLFLVEFHNRVEALLWCSRQIELRHCCDAQVKLSWLHEVYEKCIIHQKYEYTICAYLLYMVRCTIFVDKSVTFISVMYLFLLRNLMMCGGYISLRLYSASVLSHK